MGWYATRSVFHFAVKEDGKNVFEERIVCFEAADFDEANLKAAKESEQYAKDNKFEAHPEQYTYRQDGCALVDGYELWSELYESYKTLDQFYLDRYKSYEYDPEVN